ncbi:hypothetical protein M5689_018876 [Euphorbia peplus]|nr:hypothetical protein M5689_018876 [Euphorbia peplus]
MNKLIWFAAVFDPREKFEIVQISLREIYGVERGTQIVNNVHTSFFEMFQEYQKIHDVREKICDVPIEPQIVEVETIASKYELSKYVFHGMQKKQNLSSGGSRWGKRTELDANLDEVLVEDTKGLYVLNWWRVHRARFLTLGIMASDILAVSVTPDPKPAYADQTRK